MAKRKRESNPRLPAVDWQAILLDLRSHGLSIALLSSCMGIPRTTLVGWCNHGVEPRHCYGESLIALWCRTTRQTRSQIPYKRLSHTVYKPRQGSTATKPIARTIAYAIA